MHSVADTPCGAGVPEPLHSVGGTPCWDAWMMNNGDKALEAIIAQLTSAVAMTADPRLVRLQQQAIRERSPEQVEHMERQQGIDKRRKYAIANSRRRRWG